MDSSIDAAVVDLNLGRDTSQVGEIVDVLKGHFRIPVVMLTGTPEDAPDNPPVIDVFTKGTHRFEQVLDRIWQPYEIGLTEIMGGRGLIEKQLNKVFLQNLLQTLDTWVEHGKDDPERTKKALLRYVLGHLMADMEGDEIPCYPEEFYLAPPLNDKLTTGSFIRKGETQYVVMTPACDLVKHKSKRKVDSVVLVQAVLDKDVYDDLDGNSDERRKKTSDLKKNNYKLCFHRLPKTAHTDSGYLDFRKLETVPLNNDNDELGCGFERLKLRIAPSFIKDIVSRFSAFYARQGQPGISPP